MSGLINPSPATNLKFDANNNVLASINAQTINPNVNNPYGISLESHQTGLSVTATAANTPYAIGTAVTMSRTGIMKMNLIGYASASGGFLDYTITRGSTIYYFPNGSSTAIGDSAQGGYTTTGIYGNVLASTSKGTINPNINFLLPITYLASGDSNPLYFSEMPVLSGDVITLRGGHNTAGDITYVTDWMVILQ